MAVVSLPLRLLILFIGFGSLNASVAAGEGEGQLSSVGLIGWEGP